jgi:uncharacterized protein (DUF4415 family)
VVTAAAKSDPNDLALAGKQVNTMISIWVQRGRPKVASKRLIVSMRYGSEVIDNFRTTGARWQTRMNAVLKDYIKVQSIGEAKGPNIKIQRTGATACFYAEFAVRF